MGAMNFKNIGSVEYGNNKIYKIYANDGLIWQKYKYIYFRANTNSARQLFVRPPNYGKIPEYMFADGAKTILSSNNVVYNTSGTNIFFGIQGDCNLSGSTAVIKDIRIES